MMPNPERDASLGSIRYRGVADGGTARSRRNSSSSDGGAGASCLLAAVLRADAAQEGHAQPPPALTVTVRKTPLAISLLLMTIGGPSHGHVACLDRIAQLGQRHGHKRIAIRLEPQSPRRIQALADPPTLFPKETHKLLVD